MSDVSFDRDAQAEIRREIELPLAVRRQESQSGTARFANGEGCGGKYPG